MKLSSDAMAGRLPGHRRPWPVWHIAAALLLLAVAAPAPCETAAADMQTGTGLRDFRWVPSVAGRNVERITALRKVAVNVEVSVPEGISEVLFVIPSKFRAFGIGMERESAAVRDGRARSAVVFHVLQGMPLGRHALVIQVLDGRTRTEIGSGTIPFILLPSDLECLC